MHEVLLCSCTERPRHLQSDVERFRRFQVSYAFYGRVDSFICSSCSLALMGFQRIPSE